MFKRPPLRTPGRMPISKSAPAKRAAALSVQEPHELQCAADAMFRAAGECCRQQARLSRVLELSCGEDELKGVIEVSVLSARVLDTAGARYAALAADAHDGLGGPAGTRRTRCGTRAASTRGATRRATSSRRR